MKQLHTVLDNESFMSLTGCLNLNTVPLSVLVLHIHNEVKDNRYNGQQYVHTRIGTYAAEVPGE